jgi:hypothetical protein
LFRLGVIVGGANLLGELARDVARFDATIAFARSSPKVS